MTESKNTSGLDRRDFLNVASTGLAVAAGSRFSFAAGSEKVIRIGFISPRTGPLGSFGETDGFVLEKVRAALSNGFAAGGETYKVEILDRDTTSDPSRAGQLAKSLINNEKVDLMLAVSAPETVNPVSDACEAAGVPCLSALVPWEAWYFGRGAKPGQPSPFKWTYHISFGVEEFHKMYRSLWTSLETNKRVGVLYPNDADGNAIRMALAPLLAKDGFTIIDPGPYEDGTTDYSAQIALFKKERCEIFNTFPIPPDFAAMWRQAAQQGYTKISKIVQTAKTGLFLSQIGSLGELANRLAGGAFWHKTFPYSSPLTGLSAQQLAAGYEQASGRQWTQALGSTMAVFDVTFDALKRSGNPLSKEAVAKAYAGSKTQTIMGPIDFATGPVPNVAISPILGGQWIKTPSSKFKYEFVLTENANDRNVPIEAKLLPYNQ